ncbi:MAG: hypothetical protein JSU98_06075, partial [Gemmatimonadales bacterium]
MSDLGGRDSEGQSPRSRYQGRLEALDREVGVLEARSRRFTVLRSATFLSALAAWVVADLADAAGPGRGAALVLVGVFFFLVRLHRRVRAERRRVDMARQWAEEGLARLDRRWEALPAPEAGRDLTGHPYAADLDLYGPASLASLLAPVHTAPGRTTLDSWLLEPT